MRDEARPPRDVLAPALASFGAEAPSFLFAVMRDRRVPPVDDGDRLQVLSANQEELLLDAAGLMSRVLILGEVNGQLEADRGEEARLAGVKLLGAVGLERDLERVFEIATIPGRPTGRRMVDAVRSAVSSILRRDSGAFGELSSLWRGLDPALYPGIVLGIGDTRDSRGLSLLADMLQRREEIAVRALSQVRLIGPSPDPVVNLATVLRLRPYLDARSPEHCRAACAAIAAMHDAESIPLLLDLFTEGSPGVRESAHDALCEITGLSFPAESGRWSRWYANEMQWMSREKARVFGRLFSSDEVEFTKAVREARRHVLVRNELVQALCLVLQDASSVIRRSACVALSDLAAAEAVPWLVEALSDPDVGVGRSAWNALTSITGRDLPADAVTWRQAFPERPRG